MIDFSNLIDYALGGFGSGAICYSILTAVSTTAGAGNPYALLGQVFFGALTTMGVVGGLLKGRSKVSAAESAK